VAISINITENRNCRKGPVCSELLNIAVGRDCKKIMNCRNGSDYKVLQNVFPKRYQ
jgi:hypothetical protein